MCGGGGLRCGCSRVVYELWIGQLNSAATAVAQTISTKLSIIGTIVSSGACDDHATPFCGANDLGKWTSLEQHTSSDRGFNSSDELLLVHWTPL